MHQPIDRVVIVSKDDSIQDVIDSSTKKHTPSAAKPLTIRVCSNEYTENVGPMDERTKEILDEVTNKLRKSQSQRSE